MKKYVSTFRMRWKMETQYRGAAIGGIVCQMVFGLILISVYRALYQGNPQSMPLIAVFRRDQRETIKFTFSGMGQFFRSQFPYPIPRTGGFEFQRHR